MRRARREREGTEMDGAAGASDCGRERTMVQWLIVSPGCWSSCKGEARKGRPFGLVAKAREPIPTGPSALVETMSGLRRSLCQPLLAPKELLATPSTTPQRYPKCLRKLTRRSWIPEAIITQSEIRRHHQERRGVLVSRRLSQQGTLRAVGLCGSKQASSRPTLQSVCSQHWFCS